MDMKCIYGLGIMACLLSCSPAGSNRKESTLSTGTHSVTSSLGGKVLLKPYAGPDSIAQQQFLYFHLSLLPPTGTEIKKSKEIQFVLWEMLLLGRLLLQLDILEMNLNGMLPAEKNLRQEIMV
jgi:hypothetical protein